MGVLVLRVEVVVSTRKPTMVTKVVLARYKH